MVIVATDNKIGAFRYSLLCLEDGGNCNYLIQMLEYGSFVGY